MLERWLQSLKSDTDSDTATDRATPSGDTINDTSIGDIANNVSTGDASADTAKDVSIGDTANDMSTGDTAVSTGDSGVCVTCLGVLQQSHCSEEFLHRVSVCENKVSHPWVVSTQLIFSLTTVLVFCRIIRNPDTGKF